MTAQTPTLDDVQTPDEEPSGADLVIRDADSQGIAAVLDRHDEAMIVEELQRRSLRVMLYAFPQDGKEVTDLSYLGVNEAVRVMNDSGRWQVTIDRKSLQLESVEEDIGSGPEACWSATVYAVNKRTDYGQFGTFVQAKRIRLTKARAAKRRQRGDPIADDDTIADGFSRQKALNKAQRNALRVHIPETIRQTLIAQYQGDPERVRRIQAGAGAETMAELPPPLTDDEAEALKQSIRSVYDELRERDPLKLLPAAFHAYLLRSEHSHERLRDFLGYMQQQLREVQDARR